MINDLNELQKLLKLCRKQGVTEIKFGNVELKLGDIPQQQPEEMPVDKEIDQAVGLVPGFEDIDPMAFYSAGRPDQ